MIGGLVNGQIEALERWPEGYVCFNRRMMYAALDWCRQNYHTDFIERLRELLRRLSACSRCRPRHLRGRNRGRSRDRSDLLADPASGAVGRNKLFKLAWDMVGSEFAGRHLQYEKFYAGASFMVRNHAFRETPWRRVPQDHRRPDGFPRTFHDRKAKG